MDGNVLPMDKQMLSSYRQLKGVASAATTENAWLLFGAVSLLMVRTAIVSFFFFFSCNNLSKTKLQESEIRVRRKSLQFGSAIAAVIMLRYIAKTTVEKQPKMATSRLRDLETGSRKSSDSSESGRITSWSVGAADFSPPVLSTTEHIDVGVDYYYVGHSICHNILVGGNASCTVIVSFSHMNCDPATGGIDRQPNYCDHLWQWLRAMPPPPFAEFSFSEKWILIFFFSVKVELSSNFVHLHDL